VALTISTEFMTEMLNALRVNKTTTSQEEVTALINAAAAELTRRGIAEISLTDPLTKQAIKLYCKGNYGYDKEHGSFAEAFEKLANAMSLSHEYDEGGDGNG